MPTQQFIVSAKTLRMYVAGSYHVIAYDAEEAYDMIPIDTIPRELSSRASLSIQFRSVANVALQSPRGAEIGEDLRSTALVAAWLDAADEPMIRAYNLGWYPRLSVEVQDVIEQHLDQPDPDPNFTF